MFFSRKIHFVAPFALIFASIVPQGSLKADNGSGRISLSGYVAVICRAELSGGIIPTSDRVALGQLTELCNTTQGYQVIMSYPARLQGARLLIDGVAMTLDGSGQTIISDSYMSAYRIRALELDISPINSDARQNGLNVSFRAVPRGGV